MNFEYNGIIGFYIESRIFQNKLFNQSIKIVKYYDPHGIPVKSNINSIIKDL